MMETRVVARHGPLGRPVRGLLVEGEAALCVRLHDALDVALGSRGHYYRVRLQWTGPRDDVLVSVEAPTGRLPFLFHRDELDAAHVAAVVGEGVRRSDL